MAGDYTIYGYDDFSKLNTFTDGTNPIFTLPYDSDLIPVINAVKIEFFIDKVWIHINSTHPTHMDKLTITGTGENNSEISQKGSVNYNEVTGIQTYEFDPIIADTYTM